MMLPSKEGFFGEFGGNYTNEDITKVLGEINNKFEQLKNDEEFKKELTYYYENYIGRPSMLYFAKRLTEKFGGAKIYLKREDLNHTGAHKINNAIGQALLAKRLGKKRIIAETGAGQHGVAVATACSLFDMECIVYMGKEDIRKQSLNVFRMKLLGAKVVPVTRGTGTLKDAVDEAFEDLVKNYKDTFYLIGSAVGPNPYPKMVKYFQSVIGTETKTQILEYEKRLPDYLVACVGGGSNAIGMFAPFYEDKSVKMVGVEPAGKGLDTPYHAASLTKGTKGIIHGFSCHLLQDKDGNPLDVYSIASGLDYPGVGPEHSFYKETKRADYVTVTDKEAIDAFVLLSKVEGIIPAIESSHAVSYGVKLASQLGKDKIVVINLSGRGDKDVNQISEIIDKL